MVSLGPTRLLPWLCAVMLVTTAVPASSEQVASAVRPLRIDARTSIMLPDDAPAPVRHATEDLASDLAKVLGRRPSVTAVPDEASTSIIQVENPHGGEAESFGITVRGDRVLLGGADMRGTIYAIYQFSQEFLGVDPMYYWTDREPARRSHVLLPGDMRRNYPAPVFRYRGLFINDEDQLTGWAPGERTDGTAISLAVMDRIYETILRLKGNMVVPGSWIFPDDPQVRAAGRRGLIVNQHHATPLGTNVARWPARVPYNFSTHPEILKRAWTNTVRSYDPNQEILWSVGLRGLSDTPYSSTDPSVIGNDRLQGKRVGDAIAEQMRIVRSVYPNARFITNLWQEGARLVNQGDLTIPPEVTGVWADRGYGIVQDKGAVRKGDGLYYHVAMLNGKGANQLSEMVPLDRIQGEFRRFIDVGATQFMLLNVSDMRAVTMSTRAIMDMSWQGLPRTASAPDHYRQWAAEQFGARAAPAIAKAYESYYRAFPHLPGGDEYGDQLYHEEARQLILSATTTPPFYLLPGQAPRWEPAHALGIGLEPGFWRQIPADYVEKTLARELVACDEATGRWDAVWRDLRAAERLVPASRRDFFRYALLTMTAVNRNGNHMLLMLSRAIRDMRAGDRVAARRQAVAALADLNELKTLQDASEYGKWRHWWRGDWLVGIAQTRTALAGFIAYLDDPDATLPPPVVANNWQGYYHILHYEGDRTVDVR